MGILDPEIPDTGYKGSVPKYTATRRAVDNSAQEARRPGQGGRRYFSDVVYSNMDGVDQGNQMSTMIPRGTTASAIAQAERQAAGLADIQNARFAESATPSTTTPSYGAGSGYRGEPSYGAGSGYRGGRFDDADITEDALARVDLTEDRFVDNDLPETPRYAQGGLAQFGAGSGYRGIPKGAGQEVVSAKPSYGAGSGYRGIPKGAGQEVVSAKPSYGAGSGYRGIPGRTGQEGMFGMRTGPNGNMLAGGSGGRGIADGMRTGPNGNMLAGGSGGRGIADGIRTGPNGNMLAGGSGGRGIADGIRTGPNGNMIAGGGSGGRGIVADNFGEMMRRRKQMEKMERGMGERNTPENNKRLGDLLSGRGGNTPMNRQRPSGPMQNKGRRRMSDGTERVGSARNFGGIADALKQFRDGSRSPQRQSNTPPRMSGVPMQFEQRMQGFRGFAEGGIAQTSPGQGYYLGGPTDGMADEIVSTIDGEVEARLSDGEYVIPADVVSHLGNGNSAAGADKLGKMMDNVRKERTGNKKQGKKIDADKVINKMAGGIAQFDAGGQVTGQESSLSPYAGDYVVDMLGKGAAAAEMPYQAYTGPLTAGASDLQQQSFSGVGSLQTPGAMGGQGYQAGTFDSAAQQQYMNPYLQGSLNPQLRENRREAEIQRIQDAGRLTKAGAFGGSRQAIMEAEGARNLLQSQSDITARGYDTAFQQAQKQFNTEQDRGMTAQDKTNKFGFDVLTAQRNAGDTQRAIEAEGITADKAQFDEERDYAQKQIQFQKSLLEGLPIDATSNQMSGASDLSTIMAILGATGQLGEGLSDLYNTYKPGGDDDDGGSDNFEYEDYDDGFDTDQGSDYVEDEGGGNSEIYRDPMGI